MIRVATATLLAAIIALGAMLAEELGGFAGANSPEKPRAQAASTPERAESTPDHTPEWVSTILSRPLFSPDRRPTADTSTIASGLPLGLPRLSGIMVGPFGRSAIFVPEGRKPMVVAEGGRIDAWTVEAIDTEAVRVSGPGGTRTVQPTFQHASAGTPRKGLPPQR